MTIPWKEQTVIPWNAGAAQTIVGEGLPETTGNALTSKKDMGIASLRISSKK